MQRYLAIVCGLLVVASVFAGGTKEAAGAAVPSAPGPFGKYDPGLTVNTVAVVSDALKFVPGEDINHNMWVKLFKDQMNLSFNYEWTAATQDQYDSKLNVNIAAGNIPDVFDVNKTQLARLVQAGLINADLKPVYDKYATDLLKTFITQEGPYTLSSATFNGKLAATPQSASSMDWANIMWLRQDWLDKLHLKAPTTYDDFVKMVNAFTTQDPDGTGASDYVGIALSKELFNMGEADFVGFANMFHAYPTIWVKDSSGQLVYGSYQPAMKAALLAAQKLYAAGKFDKEFAVKDNTKEAELISAGKTGIEFGQQWNPLWPLQSSVDNNPKADWTPYPVPSVDSTPAMLQEQLGTSDYYVVRKGFGNPEAVFKVQNMYAKMLRSPVMDEFKYIMYDDNAGVHFQPFFYCPFRAWPSDKNLVNMRAVTAAFKTGDTSKLIPEQVSIYNTMTAYKNGNRSSWGMTTINKPDGSYKVIGDYYDNNGLLLNAFYGADTPTMTKQKAALDKLEVETFTKIIMGDPIDSFDSFVKQAMSLGGADIQKEVNAWYAAQKK